MTRTGRLRAAVVTGIVAVALAGCGGGDDDNTSATPEPGGGGTTAAADGEALFKQRCASCHTLAAADADGAVGPNLDELKPDAARVEQAIQQAPGVMPEGLAQGEEAKAIAEYVASAAGGGS
jgi:mono/diheme cytochrome c family protein